MIVDQSRTGLISGTWANLSIAVMGHISRADTLRPGVIDGLDGAPYTDILDDHPAGSGLWETARIAWETIPPGATHHLVLQDDVLLCRDFIPFVLWFIERLPTESLMPFVMGHTLYDLSRAKDVCWFKLIPGVYGQAMVKPVSEIRLGLSWLETHVRIEYKYDDRRWCFWQMVTNRPVWCPSPAALQHVGEQSVLGHPGLRNRQAAYALTPEQSALDVDWENGLNRAPLYKRAWSRMASEFEQKAALPGRELAL